MLFNKEEINQLTGTFQADEVTVVVETHKKVLTEKHIENEDALKPVADNLVVLGKGIISGVVVACAKLGLVIKKPLFRAYVSLDNQSDVPHVKLMVSDVPSCEFRFKEKIDTIMDSHFKDTFLDFMERVLTNYVSTSIGQEHVKELNNILGSIKESMKLDDVTVPFDLEFALHEKPIKFVSDEKLVLGTTYEEMFELTSPNSSLQTLFNGSEEVDYISKAIIDSIVEDWSSSPNPLIFIRKHNKYLTPVITGDLNTRRTQRADVLVRNSITLSLQGLTHRKKSLGHNLEKDGEEQFISVFSKEGKEEEPVQLLSPINTKTLVYKN